MAQNAWSFVHYTCGHQSPIHGDDAHVQRTCPACAAKHNASPKISTPKESHQ